MARTYGRKQPRFPVLLTVLLVLAFVGIIGGLRYLESAKYAPVIPAEPEVKTKTITVEGVDYYPRQDITVLMLLGIDEEGPVESSGSYRNSGEADAVVLLILDQKEESYTVLCLNRDTMLNMDTLGVRGEFAGTAYGQLALAHTYGSGLEDSGENVRSTLMNFLPGLTVDHYVALNMDAVVLANDLVGGVTVNITDDFSAVDPTLEKGTVKLYGEQALTFVRSRKDVANQLNISRMERQMEYMKGLEEALFKKLEQNDTFVVELYEQISAYMVTDCSVTVFSSLVERCGDYTLKEIISLEGKNVLGEEYYEFYPDQEKLNALALRLFYAPK